MREGGREGVRKGGSDSAVPQFNYPFDNQL